jgi:hypothetical protein
MPKWLIILLVVFLVIALGCCGTWITCTYVVGRVAKTAAEAGAARVQQAQTGGFQSDTTGAGVALPENYPAGLPAYPGFKPVFKFTIPGSDSGTVNFEGKESLDKIAIFYETELKKNGWTQTTPTTVSDDGMIQAYSKNDIAISISISGGEKTSIYITYNKIN